MADGKGSETRDAPGSGGTAPELEALSRDWITVWQSELSAWATDRERQEVWSRLVTAWAVAAEAIVQRLHSPHEPAQGQAAAATYAEARSAASVAPFGSATPVAAFDAGRAHAVGGGSGAGAELDRQQLARLVERVAELERQLAERDALAGRA